MNEIELSIIVPIYNVEKYLRQCLDSLYSIKNIKKEIILVNDSSPDNCYKIIEEYQQKYKKETIVINRKNGGLSAARNSGLKVAKGKYISFIDSDDYIDGKKFESIFICGKKLDLDIIIGKANKVWDNKKEYFEKLVVPNEFLNIDIIEGEKYLRKSLKYKKHRIEVWDDFYKREFLVNNNLKFVEGILHEDIPFTFKAFILAKKVKLFDIDFYNYRQREGSIMSTINEKSFISRIILANELINLFDEYQINKKEYNDYLIGHLWKCRKYLKKNDKKIIKRVLKTKRYSLRSLIKLIILFLLNSKNNIISIKS